MLFRWLIGLGLVGLAVLLLADPVGPTENGGPATWVGWLVLILGLVAVLIGIRAWRSSRVATKSPRCRCGWPPSTSSSLRNRSAAVFVLISTLGLAIPIGIYFLGGETAAETFAELRHWLAINNAAIIAGADGGLEPS